MGSCASKTVVRNARQASLRQASGGPARPEMTKDIAEAHGEHFGTIAAKLAK